MVATVLTAILGGCVGGSAQDVDRPRSPASEVEPGPGTLDAPGHISGLVTDVELVPIEGVDVVVTPGEHVALTDAAGRFRIGPLDPGDYTVGAAKSGYNGTEVKVKVTDDKPATVTLRIIPMAATVPYHTSESKAGYLMCHIVVRPPLNANAPCVATLEAVHPFPRGYLPDKWMIPFRVTEPGFKTLLLEMTWQPQQLGHDGLLQLTKAAQADAQTSPGSVQIGDTYYGDTQAPPFYAALHAGRSYWNTTAGPRVFYPTPNSTADFVLLFGGGGENVTAPFAVFLEFRSAIWLTFFYNRQMTPGFSILPDK